MVANDPFFGRPGRMLAANQRSEELKFELVVPVVRLGVGRRPSRRSNRHLDHFARPFGIDTADGEVAHTACFGFGIDRIALALFDRHGTRSDRPGQPRSGRRCGREARRPGPGAVVTTVLPELSAPGFTPHPLHAPGRTWTETNCYVDVWIEVLHALGLDPVAAAAFTLSSDFEGDQWTFFKFPPEDLRALFGLEVAEMNVWRPVADHVAEQLDLGRLLHGRGATRGILPDTRASPTGPSTSRRPSSRSRCSTGTAGRLGYFHNAGLLRARGGRLRRDLPRSAATPTRRSLAPYVEAIRLDRVRRDDPGPGRHGRGPDPGHLGRRPVDNPVRRMAARIEDDLPWLASQDLDVFHRYAFGTVPPVRGQRRAGGDVRRVARGRRRTADRPGRRLAPGRRRRGQDPPVRPGPGRAGPERGPLRGAGRMAEQWDAAMDALVAHYGG